MHHINSGLLATAHVLFPQVLDAAYLAQLLLHPRCKKRYSRCCRCDDAFRRSSRPFANVCSNTLKQHTLRKRTTEILLGTQVYKHLKCFKTVFPEENNYSNPTRNSGI